MSEIEKEKRSIEDKDYLSWHWLLAVSHQLLDVAGDGSAGQGDVLNAAADHIAICHRNNVGNTVSRIDDSSGQGTFFYLSKEVSKEEKERTRRAYAGGCPGGSKCQDSLDGNI